MKACIRYTTPCSRGSGSSSSTLKIECVVFDYLNFLVDMDAMVLNRGQPKRRTFSFTFDTLHQIACAGTNKYTLVTIKLLKTITLARTAAKHKIDSRSSEHNQSVWPVACHTHSGFSSVSTSAKYVLGEICATVHRIEAMMIDENKLLFMHAQDRVNHSPSSDIDFPFLCRFPFFIFSQ